MCLGMRGTLRYQKYGRASTCKDGKGYSSSASDVYQIGGKYFIQGEGAGNSGIRAFSRKKNFRNFRSRALSQKEFRNKHL